METAGYAVLFLFVGALVWATLVDIVRALASGRGIYRIGKWCGPWDHPISREHSPFAFWSALVLVVAWLPVLILICVACAWRFIGALA